MSERSSDEARADVCGNCGYRTTDLRLQPAENCVARLKVAVERLKESVRTLTDRVAAAKAMIEGKPPYNPFEFPGLVTTLLSRAKAEMGKGA